MRVMPIMKQERELISEKDYKEFIHKNEKVLSKNFEKNAYLALLMQEMQQKVEVEQKKWTQKWGFINDEPKTYHQRTFNQ